MVTQHIITLTSRPRGFHLITQEIVAQSPSLVQYSVGIAQMFLLHTSASLSLNENVDPSVRVDFETFTNTWIPEHFERFTHTYEGADDMPAHIKSSVYGTSLTVPVRDGTLLLGTWQGIYYNEHRNHSGVRKLAITIMGE